MDFDFDARTVELRDSLLDFMDQHVYPAEPVFAQQLAAQPRPVGVGRRARARGAARRGPPARPVEPVPARRPRRRADQPAVRAAGRDHRAQHPPGAARAELLGARHRQHGGAGPVRHRRAEEGVARPAAGGRDPLVVRDDRAGRGLLRRHQHRHPHRPRRRRVRRQRPQVVDHRRDEPQREDLHRHGQERPRRRAAPPAVDDPRAAGHPRACEIERGMHVLGYDDHEHGGHAELSFTDVRVPADQPDRAARATGSASRRPAWARAGSTTACARSGWPSGPSS